MQAKLPLLAFALVMPLTACSTGSATSQVAATSAKTANVLGDFVDALKQLGAWNSEYDGQISASAKDCSLTADQLSDGTVRVTMTVEGGTLKPFFAHSATLAHKHQEKDELTTDSFSDVSGNSLVVTHASDAYVIAALTTSTGSYSCEQDM